VAFFVCMSLLPLTPVSLAIVWAVLALAGLLAAPAAVMAGVVTGVNEAGRAADRKRRQMGCSQRSLSVGSPGSEGLPALLLPAFDWPSRPLPCSCLLVFQLWSASLFYACMKQARPVPPLVDRSFRSAGQSGRGRQASPASTDESLATQTRLKSWVAHCPRGDLMAFPLAFPGVSCSPTLLSASGVRPIGAEWFSGG
jgi:hypothetical protein